MIAASLYIIVCSARNRSRMRLRRLREPRYLIGALVGAAYIYFSFFARFGARGSRRRRAGTPAGPPAALAAAASASGPALAGVLLMAVTAVGWLAPFDSGLLTFSEAEVQFLFPAPVSRRSLLGYRMLRSQIGLLFGSAIVALATPSLDGYARLRIAFAMWLLMSTGKIYFTGISLARSRLAARDGRARRVAWLPLVILTFGLAVVGSAFWRSLRAMPPEGVGDFIERLGGVATTGAAAVVLWPFMAVARPLFAPWPGPYLAAVALSGCVLAAVGLWVVLSDSAFQDAAEEANARRRSETKIAASRYTARTTPWQLGLRGRPETAFAWKAALQTVRLVGRGNALRIAAATGAFIVAILALGRRSGGDALATFALAAAAFSIVIAPQALRIDLRQDLQHLDLIKTWPVRAASVIRGELLWPSALLTVVAWTLLAFAFALPGGPFRRVDTALRLSAGISAIIAAPALIIGQLVIHNAMALAFPAWVPLGSQRARGLDVMGQRIILLGGTWLLLLLMLIPALIPAAAVWFALRLVVHTMAWVPAAFVVACVLSVEAFVATELLAPLYEGLDISGIERPE